MSYRLMPVVTAVYILLLAASVQGCGGRDAAIVVPRRTAYPRIQLCDTIYRSELIAGKSLMLNAGASVSVEKKDDGVVWVDVSYPGYGMTMRLSLTRPADVAAAMANRMERIGLNVGDAPAEVMEVGRDAIEGIVVRAPESRVTPLQMLVTDNSTFVLYGVVDVPDSTAVRDVEEMRPVVDALQADMVKIVGGL